jgi:hypothetical protein
MQVKEANYADLRKMRPVGRRQRRIVASVIVGGAAAGDAVEAALLSWKKSAAKGISRMHASIVVRQPLRTCAAARSRWP